MNPSLPTYDVMDYGAKGDGKNMDTMALQAALNACKNSNGGVVLLKSGYLFLSYPITFLSNNTILNIEKGAVLIAHNDIPNWPTGKNDDYLPLLAAKKS
jgi:polygalacturonase